MTAQKTDDILGTYRRLPVENPWHIGTISYKNDSEKVLQWTNKAGVSWDIFADFDQNILKTGDDNPYFDSGLREFKLKNRGGEVTGFTFGSDFFSRQYFESLSQSSEGLKGYISMHVPSPPEGFGYGVSFYSSIWSLIDTPLTSFQIGLPSTWIIPDNRDFTKPLCPPGTIARDNWPERGPYYRDVFQTIEGGLGYWVSTQFGSARPKYRMNGTPNGYNHEISSPGWGFGKVKALSGEKVGIAQLTNCLLIPPDGIIFRDGSDGNILGTAWMALPVTPKKEGPPAPTGDMCWTLFLNSSSFKGAVAFWIPETWSRLSREYDTIIGRGLDNRPGVMNSGAMEINTVPYFDSEDAMGNKYTRIPRFKFPVNQDGITTLMQDVTMYSKESIYQQVKAWAKGAQPPKGSFGIDDKSLWKPVIKSNAISLKQGPKNLPLLELDKILRTTIFRTNESHSFGLEWIDENTGGLFPEYFKQEGEAMVPVSVDEVPEETKLVPQKFMTYESNHAYLPPHPQEQNDHWSVPGPCLGPFKAMLSDSSEVTYSWYRFVDQPAFQHLNWSQSEKKDLQKLVEEMHAKWTPEKEYIPPPESGRLVEIDPALILKPPKGLEIGYVPIVLKQMASKC
ncbi:TPA: hypothetical protein EYN98_28695 [Candidatus Poribacteria bacterium]|jgi:hypothetical protein|nr:hypothetical protein [Candidatus Poribacteria bacterium]HIB87776.1 hypothetical protein [Candidatus Poribacteria bacterium]HIC03611.1 hypothetical protein [Candidatus Poribacteria bacterium]HIO08820.1 hypothetical protein [Candidatus Poribacteria bacterium]HIO48076.1 hypothetical protein [Candidatus Poribacteria bacterium]